MAGMVKLLCSLNPSKDPGQDMLHPRILEDALAPLLTLIFQLSVDHGSLPLDSWLMANVAPVFKKGERYNASVYIYKSIYV